MEKKAILTKDAPAPIGPYSQGIRVGNILFCSGQIPLDPVTNQIVPGDVKVQTRQVMENISAVLKAGGATFDNVVKTTIYLKTMNDFPSVNEIYGAYFASLSPARSTVAVAGLPRDVSVEIEVTAFLS